MAIKSVVCCCGMGLGTSLLAKMNVEKTLKQLGVSGVSVEHSSISDALVNKFDLYVVSKDLAKEVASLSNVIILENIMNGKELETKLRQVFNV
ncbi:MAG: PTS sugar transporter subunit IIB [Spirochaetaceae bacterium]|jgi:PTS system ascorbate-specific IIB component|nr:PTS sugar transporter subunit IIB [Spirochaetaceae bacterium]